MLVVSLAGSKKLLKNLAGFVSANTFIIANGYADDLLQEVSAGPWSPNFQDACLPGTSKLSINPAAIGSNRLPDSSTGRYDLIRGLPYLPGSVAMALHNTSLADVYGAGPYSVSQSVGFSECPSISHGLTCGASVS